MTAYKQSYLLEAMQNLGDATDFATNLLKLPLSKFWTIFSMSENARAFERGIPWAVVGISGEELALRTIEQTGASSLLENNQCLGISINSVSPYITFENKDIFKQLSVGLSQEYWCGYSLAYLQWKTDSTFAEINEVLPIEKVASMYRTYHEQSEERFAEAACEIISQSNIKRGLKFQRELIGLSQSQLAKKSGVGIRAIQQYEQGSKDIKRASFETIERLCKTLYCRPKDLISNLECFEYFVTDFE